MYVIKRPGVDNFLKKMGEIYEVVVFTASLSKVRDPITVLAAWRTGTEMNLLFSTQTLFLTSSMCTVS